MGYKIKFDNLETMYNFITYATFSVQYRLSSWQCKKFTLTNIQGSMMDINTKQYGGTDFVLFNSVYPYIKQFREANASTAIRLDIKLICPNNLRQSIDTKNLFSDFYLAFYSFNDENSYLNCGFQEATGLVLEDTSQLVDYSKQTDEQAIAYSGFVAYIQQMYDAWYVYYNSYFN